MTELSTLLQATRVNALFGDADPASSTFIQRSAAGTFITAIGYVADTCLVRSLLASLSAAVKRHPCCSVQQLDQTVLIEVDQQGHLSGVAPTTDQGHSTAGP